MPNQQLIALAKTIVKLAILIFGAFLLVTASGAAWMQGNWLFAIGLIVGGLFFYWFVEEADSDDAAADTADRVADRAADLFGGFIGGTGAFIVSMAAIALAGLDQILFIVDLLITMFAGQPLVSVTLAGIGGIFGLAATLGLPAETAGLLIIVLLVSVALLRRRLVRSAFDIELEDD